MRFACGDCKQFSDPLHPPGRGYNPLMRNLDIDAVLQRLAERRIEEAMKEGKFDNLPGYGKPLDPEPLPADENARMMWWALKLMKQSGHTTDEVAWRKQIQLLKDELSQVITEQRIRVLVEKINLLVRRLNTLGTNAINVPVAPVDLETELKRLRERNTSGAAPRVVEPPPLPSVALLLHCRNRLCETRHPPSARFCRRCGAAL